MRLLTRVLVIGVGLSFASGLAMPVADAAGVVVNGTRLPSYPAPIERAGRLYVPLRAIFEALGATVVYEAGTINATSGPRTVQLHIGSTIATVGGRQEVLDAAPFIVGAFTYVPLRFVSQSLGAAVNYDFATQIAYVDLASAPRPPPPNAPPVNPPVYPPPERPQPIPVPEQSQVRLRDQEPAPGAVIPGRQPTISASFTYRVRPDSVRITLDGDDVTGRATVSQTGIVYAPHSPLLPGNHTVRVTGRDTTGARFERGWSFTTSGRPATKNFVTLSAPQPDSPVGATFTVSGTTLPNARVRIVAGRVRPSTLQDVFAFLAGNVTVNVTAGPRGNFQRQVTISLESAGPVGVTVTSTAPATGEVAQAKVRLRGIVPQPR